MDKYSTKEFAFGTDEGKGNCNIKQFTLNWKNADMLNIKSMKKVLDGEVKIGFEIHSDS